MAGAIQECLPLSDKPIIAYVSPHAPHVAAVLTSRGVPAFAVPESCAVALVGMLQVGRWIAPAEECVTRGEIAVDDFPAGSLDEAQAKALFVRFGVPVARERIVSTPAQAKAAAQTFGCRTVLKILSGEITHKSDVGGVAINLTADAIGERLAEMASEVEAKTGVRPRRFLVQEMIEGGTELIIGMHRDALGTAILVGMGGVMAELFKDTTMRLLPPAGGLARDEALAMARELMTWPLLDGFRGRPKADVNALAAAIVAFSHMAAQLGERLIEAEINPLFVLPRGHGVRAADGVVVLAPPQRT
jgi:acyl-CoA synthetase (NDP forming)